MTGKAKQIRVNGIKADLPVDACISLLDLLRETLCLYGINRYS